MLVFPLAQAFRECVKTRVRTRSGSDGTLTIPRNLMIRSLPLAVLTQTLHAWKNETKVETTSSMSLSRNPVGMQMFIEKVTGDHLGSPFMDERCSVALLKELPDLNSVWCSINILPLRGFFDRLLLQASLWINIRTF